MITEKHFSLSHAAFWHQLMPMTESYIRECNTEAARFLSPLEGIAPPTARGMVNELAFRIFAMSVGTGQPAAALSPAELDACVAASVQHVSRMRQLHRVPVAPPDSNGRAEAQTLAERLRRFVERANLPSLEFFPSFPGCGWLDQCEGDLLAPGVLVEVKAGERGFRGSDIRQMLCYCALNFASKKREIADLCLVNPRSGRYITASIEYLCMRVAGRSAAEVLADIVEYVSEPPGRYVTG